MGPVHHGPGDAAKQQVLQAAVAPSPDHDHVGLPGARGFKKADCRRGVALKKLRPGGNVGRQRVAGVGEYGRRGTADDRSGALRHPLLEFARGVVERDEVGRGVDEVAGRPHRVEGGLGSVNTDQDSHGRCSA